MKSLVLVISLLGVTAFAIPGGNVVNHTLNCSIPQTPRGEKILGSGYTLQCATQALAPQYNLRGCRLLQWVTSPYAKARVIELNILKQDASQAQLVNRAERVEVRFYKSNFSALVIFPHRVTSQCAVSDQSRQK